MTNIHEQMLSLSAKRHTAWAAFRQELHRFPELSHEEHQTTARVEGFLCSLDLPLTMRRGPKGVGLIVDAGPPALPRIALRADLDALAVEEKTGLAFASEHPGLMHACGHDMHTTCVAAALETMVRVAPDVPMRFVFQPAEESLPSGAPDMIAADALDNVTAILALHCDPTRPVGKIGLKVGALTASNDEFTVTLTGMGGHGARPHKSRDLVLCGTQIIQALYNAFDRGLDARDPFVISVGVLHAGDKSPNVLPSTLRFAGTCRSISRESRAQIEPIMHRVLGHMCEMLGIEYTLTIRRGAPSVQNDAQVVAALQDAATAMWGADCIEDCGPPSMGGEDFAWYLEQVPGAMFRLGTGISTPLHSSTFVADDEALAIAVPLLSRAALSLSQSLGR